MAYSVLRYPLTQSDLSANSQKVHCDTCKSQKSWWLSSLLCSEYECLNVAMSHRSNGYPPPFIWQNEINIRITGSSYMYSKLKIIQS